MHVSGPENAFEEQLMRQALALAHRGEGCVEPNPMVGAVIASGAIVLASCAATATERQ